jgi:hypothetical protein
MDEMGFSADVRTEQLGVPTLIQLTERLRGIAPDWSLG